MSKHLNSSNLIYDRQNDFLKESSTKDLFSFLSESWFSPFRHFGESFVSIKGATKLWILNLPLSVSIHLSNCLSDISKAPVINGPRSSSRWCSLVICLINSLTTFHQWPIHCYSSSIYSMLTIKLFQFSLYFQRLPHSTSNRKEDCLAATDFWYFAVFLFGTEKNIVVFNNP